MMLFNGKSKASGDLMSAGQKEKKVEYVELIYDLIFVYMIGRNNALLHNIENGFVAWGSFLAYFLCTLAVIQIWNFSTYYINMYGRNSLRNHIFMFINMFLLYFMGTGTRQDWQAYQEQYHIAWALILVNVAAQYLIELRHYKDEEKHRSSIVKVAVILLIEAAIIFSAVFIQDTPGIFLSAGAIFFGIIVTHIAGKGSYLTVDFMHLSERAMLYVVFTFGEMIIVIAGYFDGQLSLWGIYFAFMAFLIVAGLFLSYEVLYDHIIDREKKTNGLSYMFMHVWMIFGLNNISSALEFMREEKVSLMPKMIFLLLSFVIYYGFLFATRKYAKPVCRREKRLFLPMTIVAVSFVALMLLFRNMMAVNIAVTVIYAFIIFLILYRYAKKIEAKE